MKIKALGRGGAFAPISIGNSNFIIESDSGKRMVVDWGTTAPYIYRDELSLDFGDIDALYLTHLHGDHIGGIELLAFHRYFLPKKDKNGNKTQIKLFTVTPLMEELWENSLRGGLESLQGKIMNLTDYFECHPICKNGNFKWEGCEFTPIQTIHVRSAYIIKHSYGLMIKTENGKKVYITSDTQFDPQLVAFYNDADLILQDCETGPYRSIVHAHYDDLKTLPEDVRKKMFLYHYNEKVKSVLEDGFAGFVEKGQSFEI